MCYGRAGCSLIGCCLVSLFVSIGYADNDSSPATLAATARAAKAHFTPLTKDDLQQARKELLAAADRLDGRLKQDAVYGEGWRKYTQLDKLLEQLHQPTGPDLAGAKLIREKLAAGHEGLEQVWFVDVRHGLEKYISTIVVIDNPEVEKSYDKVLDDLARDLESDVAKPDIDRDFHIGGSLALLENAGQAPQLVETVRSRLGHPNFHVQVAADLIAAGVGRTGRRDRADQRLHPRDRCHRDRADRRPDQRDPVSRRPDGRPRYHALGHQHQSECRAKWPGMHL